MFTAVVAAVVVPMGGNCSKEEEPAFSVELPVTPCVEDRTEEELDTRVASNKAKSPCFVMVVPRVVLASSFCWRNRLSIP